MQAFHVNIVFHQHRYPGQQPVLFVCFLRFRLFCCGFIQFRDTVQPVFPANASGKSQGFFRLVHQESPIFLYQYSLLKQ